jgi:hypothetical protein
VSLAALATLTLIGEGCGHHIWSLLLFWRILPFIVIVPLSVFWMAEAFRDSWASSSAAA